MIVHFFFEKEMDEKNRKGDNVHFFAAQRNEPKKRRAGSTPRPPYNGSSRREDKNPVTASSVETCFELNSSRCFKQNETVSFAPQTPHVHPESYYECRSAYFYCVRNKKFAQTLKTAKGW